MTLTNHDGLQTLDDRSLPALLLGAEPVIVESHFASWDKPWRALDDVAWQELQREFGERVNYGLIDTGTCRELAVRYGLEILPEVLVFVRGKLIARFYGWVKVSAVIAAVRAGLGEERAQDEAVQELEAEARRAKPEPARSILRKRPGTVSVAVLAPTS